MSLEERLQKLAGRMNAAFLPRAETVDVEDGIAVFRDADGNPIAFMNPDDYLALRERLERDA